MKSPPFSYSCPKNKLNVASAIVIDFLSLAVSEFFLAETSIYVLQDFTELSCHQVHSFLPNLLKSTNGQSCLAKKVFTNIDFVVI